MSARSERALLGVAALAALAFVASFFAGLGWGDAEPPPRVVRTAPAVPEPGPSAGRVEVLNASERAGLARRVTDRLRDAGYDVVGFGNAPGGTPDRSVVLSRRGDGDVARALAALLRIDSVRADSNDALGLDATVILGADLTEPDGRAPVP